MNASPTAARRTNRKAAKPAVDQAAPQFHSPAWSLLGTEPWRAVTEFVSYKVAAAPASPPGDGHPVLLFPGLGSDGLALAPLREHLAALGYEALDWGRGRNLGPQGDVQPWLEALAADVQRLIGHGRVPSLVGWSLGGIYARELAKLPALRVRQVITLGTPFNGEPSQTNAGWAYQLLNGRTPPTDRSLRARLRQPPPVPTTSIYSRNDGIVAWQACRHSREAAQVQDIEVAGSHLGMGWNRQVLNLVADRLAQPLDGWQRHAAAGAEARAARRACALPSARQTAAV